MKHTREPRNKPTHSWSIGIDKDAKNTQRGKNSSSINGVGKTGYPCAKE